MWDKIVVKSAFENISIEEKITAIFGFVRTYIDRTNERELKKFLTVFKISPKLIENLHLKDLSSQEDFDQVKVMFLSQIEKIETAKSQNDHYLVRPPKVWRSYKIRVTGYKALAKSMSFCYY